MATPDRSLIGDYQSPGRPLGYFLWGVLSLIIGGMLAATPLLIFLPVQSGTMSYQPQLLGWLVGVPIASWLFIIVPLATLSQAALAFVASALAVLPYYERTVLVEFAPASGVYRTMEARADIRVLQVLSAASLVGFMPGWQFAISAMVLTAGAGLVLTVPTVGGAIAGVMLVLVGVGGSLVGIRNRVNAELKKSAPKRSRRKATGR